MRRLSVAVLTTAVVGFALVASASLAAPRAAATYRGTGRDVFNNGPGWHTAPGADQSISFKVSPDGARVLSFRGRYVYYCGSGTSTLTASSLRIHAGRFGGTGKRTDKSGTHYLALSGRFAAGGHTATVRYLDDFVPTGSSVKDPYSFAYHRPTLACESRVTGTVSTG